MLRPRARPIVDGVDGREVDRIDDLGVIELRKRFCGDSLARQWPAGARSLVLRPQAASATKPQRLGDADRCSPFIGSRGADCGSTSPARRARGRSATATISTSMSRSITIRRMMASCWKSFWPNTATSGRMAPNSLATTVVTPRKCPGRPRLPATSASRPGSTWVWKPVGIHRGRGRRVHRVDAGGSARFDVVVDRSRVAVEVVAAVELQRVDEDRHDDDVASSAGLLDQRQVAGVQRTHRRHAADSTPLGASLPGSTRASSRGSRQISMERAFSGSCGRRRATCRREPRGRTPRWPRSPAVRRLA